MPLPGCRAEAVDHRERTQGRHGVLGATGAGPRPGNWRELPCLTWTGQGPRDPPPPKPPAWAAGRPSCPLGHGPQALAVPYLGTSGKAGGRRRKPLLPSARATAQSPGGPRPFGDSGQHITLVSAPRHARGPPKHSVLPPDEWPLGCSKACGPTRLDAPLRGDQAWRCGGAGSALLPPTVHTGGVPSRRDLPQLVCHGMRAEHRPVALTFALEPPGGGAAGEGRRRGTRCLMLSSAVSGPGAPAARRPLLSDLPGRV